MTQIKNALVKITKYVDYMFGDKLFSDMKNNALPHTPIIQINDNNFEKSWFIIFTSKQFAINNYESWQYHSSNKVPEVILMDDTLFSNKNNDETIYLSL